MSGTDTTGQQSQNGPPSTGVTELEQLKFLMDYTKFHIGLYATVITILLAVASIGGKTVPCIYHQPVVITLVCVLLAGLAGGIIAGHIPEQTSFKAFWYERTGPWSCKCIPTRYVARFEHVVFWIGVANACAAVIWQETYWFASAPCPQVGT